jgi:wyosine [tRNA(Phe)-imidazoG37] synthetase (radical SAM superfamily)
MIAFGPVPSRRLGRSLGINNIPPKICSYACVYCQLGRTLKMQVERQFFYAPEEIFGTVREKAEKTKQGGESIDYLTFVPDGEPTLDINLGPAIDLLKKLDTPIAVITNTSLIGRPDVRKDLMGANWVSLKMDAIDERVWRRILRPHGKVKLASLLEGALEFSKAFPGQLATETMLVGGINDSPPLLEEVADFVARLKPSVAYLAVPTRPPAEAWVRPPGEDALNRAFQIFRKKIDRVEYLIGYEGNAFSSTGNVEEDLLSITSVHPMREKAVGEFLARAGADWSSVQRLISQGHLVETEYGGHHFYLRRLRKPAGGKNLSSAGRPSG